MAGPSAPAWRRRPVLTHGRSSIVCIGDAYGGTLELLTGPLPLLVSTARSSSAANCTGSATCWRGRQAGVLQTPTNPTLELFDIRHRRHRPRGLTPAWRWTTPLPRR